jgi:hypothetical protein
MAINSPPRTPVECDELDALIEEARRRARRRRLGYVAALAAALGLGALLYAGFGSGGGGGETSASHAGSGPTPAASASRSNETARHAVYEHRCPGRGLSALPLGPKPEQAARAITAQRVGASPLIDVAIHPGTWRDSGMTYLCGPRIARRTLEVLIYDHRFDHGPNKSASLAQHRFYVSRFADGYHAWYWEH